MLQCPDRDTPSNATVIESDTNNVHSIRTIICNAGFSLDGNQSVTCTENETWSSEDPECLGKELCLVELYRPVIGFRDRRATVDMPCFQIYAIDRL